MRTAWTFIAAPVLAVLLAAPAGAVEDYEACVALAEENPERAEAEAAARAESGGGAAARHCRALALMGLGAERSAAALLDETAVGDRTLPAQVRADMLVEAGRIWLGLGALEPARAAAERALRIAEAPRAALVLIARLDAEAERWQAAEAALDRALAEGEPAAEILVLRASARRHLDKLAGARADLEQAAGLAPEDPALWLERGSVEAAAGDLDAARAAWLEAIALDREGPVGAAARLRLQRMDAG